MSIYYGYFQLNFPDLCKTIFLYCIKIVGAYAPRNQASSSGAVSEYAESTIFYQISKDVKEIIRKLNSECSKKFISDKVNKEDLKKLDSSQV